jgi:hypothetical protein
MACLVHHIMYCRRQETSNPRNYTFPAARNTKIHSILLFTTFRTVPVFLRQYVYKVALFDMKVSVGRQYARHSLFFSLYLYYYNELISFLPLNTKTF